MTNTLDKSINWDRMSKGVKWPKMVLTYSDGSKAYTDGTTYQCEHGIRKNSKRPISISVLDTVDSEILGYLQNSLNKDGTITLAYLKK